MFDFLRKLFYGTIKCIVFLFFPVVWIYNRFLTNAVNEVIGFYWKSQIKNKGKDLRIHGRINVLVPNRLEIGDYCRIGKGAFLFCYGGLKIGNNVQFSRNITIYTANHDFKNDVLPYNDKYLVGPVTIGNNVWLGMNVSILPNVSIGDNVIIGMNAVITKNIPDNAIVVGNNRIVGYRPDEQIKKSEGRYFGKIFSNM